VTDLLEVAAHGITAILATWLGLLVVTRARRAPGAAVFSVLCFLLVTWCVAIIVQRLGTDEAIKPALNLAEDAAAFLLPAVTTHLAMTIAFEGRRSGIATAALVGGYVLGVAATAQAVIDPGHPIQFSAPAFSPFGIPGAVVAWAFAAARLSVWGAGIGFLVGGLRAAGEDHARRRQVAFALATVILGVVGGTLRILPEQIGGPPWVGVSIIAVAIVLATYAVVAGQVFLSADVAGRAVRWSLAAGLGIVGYVAVLIGLEEAASRILSIDLPIVSALAVVVTLALFDPVAAWVRQRTAGSPEAAAEARLLAAMGSSAIATGDTGSSLRAGLARLVRTFELGGAVVVDRAGSVQASAGAPVDPDDPRTIAFPLVGSDPPRRAVFGPKRTGLAFTPAEVAGLEEAASFLGSSVALLERREAQVAALAGLRAEQEAVEERGSALTDALAEATVAPSGLYVHALGSLHAEVDGEPLLRWGGAKAGSRQAEAIFACLFDRGDRGVGKDEMLELVWPDVDLDRADVAFHRTMLGLRSALAPGRRARTGPGPIAFANDRYRLDPTIVTWSDVAEFERLLADAGSSEPDEGLLLLERARALYRGDYLDDCPYYGDSADVEDRREELRRRYVDLLVELAERYEARGDRSSAAASLRRAQSLAGEDLPQLAAALGRLGSASPTA
jgi:DNA-binding SARP family transcriptional activator